MAGLQPGVPLPPPPQTVPRRATSSKFSLWGLQQDWLVGWEPAQNAWRALFSDVAMAGWQFHHDRPFVCCVPMGPDTLSRGGENEAGGGCGQGRGGTARPCDSPKFSLDDQRRTCQGYRIGGVSSALPS